MRSPREEQGQERVDEVILRTLRRVRRRLTAVRSVESGLRWGLYGAGLAAVLVALGSLVYSVLPAWYRDVAWPWGPLVLIPLAFAAGALARMVRRVTLRDAAVYLDRRAGLEERVSTAYELMRDGEEGQLVGLVYQQAHGVCERFDPRMIRYSRRLGREARYGVVALVVCAAMVFVPPYKTTTLLANEAAAQRNDRAAKAMVRAIEPIRKAAIEKDPELAELLKKAEALAEEMRSTPMAPERSLAELNRMKKDMEEMKTERQAQEDLSRRVDDAQKSNDATSALGDQNQQGRQDKLNDLAQKMAEGKLSESEKTNLKQIGQAAEKAGKASGDKALEQAGKELAEAASGKGGSEDSIKDSLNKVAEAAQKAGANTSGQPSAGMSQEDLAAALDAIDQAKQAMGGQQTASAGQQGGQQGGGQQGGGQQQCSTCGGTGKDANGDQCPDCGGSGMQQGGQQGQGQSCSDCNGTGKTPDGGKCGTCNGSGNLPGTGSTNMDNPSGPGGHMELPDPQAERDWARIYESRSIEHTADRQYVQSKYGEGRSAAMMKVKGEADPDSRTEIEYVGVDAAARREAAKALDENPIPADQRNMVKRYFEQEGQ